VNGDRPIGLAVGVIVVAALVLLPALIVPTFYLFANVYAVIVGTDFSSDAISVSILLVGLMLVVATFVLLLFAGVSLIGRALSPRQR
jgi:hypothetical protein